MLGVVGLGPRPSVTRNIGTGKGSLVDLVKQSSRRRRPARSVSRRSTATFSQDEITEFVHNMLGKMKIDG